MCKQILIPQSVKREMIKTFSTTKETLWNALTFKTDSPFANMLRAAAIERGGRIFDGKKRENHEMPDCETFFETSRNVMTQIFSPRVSLIADLSEGSVTVCVDGTAKSIYDAVTLQQLPHLQTIAAELAESLQ